MGDQSSLEGPTDIGTVNQPRPTEADVQALEEKLQRLSDGLPPGEQTALGRLLALAAAGNEAAETQGEEDVQGYLASIMAASKVYVVSANRVSLSAFSPRLSTCGSSGTCKKCRPGG